MSKSLFMAIYRRNVKLAGVMSRATVKIWRVLLHWGNNNILDGVMPHAVAMFWRVRTHLYTVSKGEELKRNTHVPGMIRT